MQIYIFEPAWRTSKALRRRHLSHICCVGAISQWVELLCEYVGFEKHKCCHAKCNAVTGSGMQQWQKRKLASKAAEM